MACATLATVLAIRPAPAQSANDIGAWDALMLSPTGALPPQARAGADGGGDEWSLRYGYWRYDSDDTPHNNMGVTYSHDLGAGRTTLAFTGAHLAMSCDQCSGWWLAGAESRSTLFEHGSGSGPEPSLWEGVGVRTMLAAARFRGSPGASAVSAGATLDLRAAASLGKSIVATASVLPGVGFGKISSIDETGHGFRPMLGVALGLALGRLRVDLGMEHVQIAGAPSQVGLGVGWSAR